ncbi:MAG: hypothetical protein GW893_06485, partial [Armatimonadetes bacterium]|nr:hypothetical protein [Armatimonadota bacterium]
PVACLDHRNFVRLPCIGQFVSFFASMREGKPSLFHPREAKLSIAVALAAERKRWWKSQ